MKEKEIEEIREVYDQLNTIGEMVNSLVELLGEILTQEYETEITRKEVEMKEINSENKGSKLDLDELDVELYAVMKSLKDDSRVFLTLNEYLTSLEDLEFERIYLPVICKCGTLNILVGENIEIVEVDADKIVYSCLVHGKCASCGKPLKAKIKIFELPNHLSYFEIHRTYNCKLNYKQKPIKSNKIKFC